MRYYPYRPSRRVRRAYQEHRAEIEALYEGRRAVARLYEPREPPCPRPTEVAEEVAEVRKAA